MKEKVLILDFGAQYTQLIARRVRELEIYSEIIPYNALPAEIPSDVKALILSGSPFSVRDANALRPDLSAWAGNVPILGICYGAQYIADSFGGNVARSDKREYGKARIHIVKPEHPFFSGIPQGSQVWMSHGDTILELPEGFELLAETDSIPVAAYASQPGRFDKMICCVQYHPEVTHSLDGHLLLSNFLRGIAGLKERWTPDLFIEETIEVIRQQTKGEEVLMALSGGVDSTVGAILLHRAIGEKLHCFFIDNGLLRKNEFQLVMDRYAQMGLKVHGIDAKQKFYTALEGITDPELKRKTIGRLFIEVFEEEAAAYPAVKWLGQGTIYPDVIESISVHGPSATIKSHHNVGGLPEHLKLKIVEPLRMLFKDEVRKVGDALGIPADLIGRHPFPGPGLAIRIISDITPEKVATLQEADAIYTDILRKHGWYDKIWQAGAILLPILSVGVMGDERSYENAIALRAVNSLDGMTAEWSKIPHEILAEISSEIINKVKGINRVVYDISTKPPATIEWE
ncbi:MAG: glutamine-hydrolyzing GMP synthase [Saprospiraceae bacterium]|nr:glutamine-hydrolyzing GMP synthase [Candidatus Opimibacter iunctus]